MRLSKTDLKVIDAFLDKAPLSSKKLRTDGKTLDIIGLGGNNVVTWKNDKVVFHDLGSKSQETVQRAVRKKAPKNWIAASTSVAEGLDPDYDVKALAVEDANVDFDIFVDHFGDDVASLDEQDFLEAATENDFWQDYQDVPRMRKAYEKAYVKRLKKLMDQYVASNVTAASSVKDELVSNLGILLKEFPGLTKSEALKEMVELYKDVLPREEIEEAVEHRLRMHPTQAAAPSPAEPEY